MKQKTIMKREKGKSNLGKGAIHILFAMGLLILLTISCTQTGTRIYDLTVNYTENPMGIDADNILFGWKMGSDLVGQSQTAYQITVKEEDGNELWNSGIVKSDLSVAIPYTGPEPARETRYSWNVSATCADGEVITSAPAWFETGTDFSGAEWITYRPPVDNCFDDSYQVSVTPTIMKGGFTLYFAIKNDSNRFAWIFNNNILTANKVGVSGNGELSSVDLTGIIRNNVPFDLVIDVTDASIVTRINGEQVNSIDHSYAIEKPYVGLMVSQAQVDRRTREVRSPAQAARFGNLMVTVDGVSENVGEASFELIAPEPDLSGQAGGGGFGGFGGGQVQGVSIMQTDYQGQPVEYLAESTTMPMFRTEQELKGRVESARLYITSLGVFDAFVNGQEVMTIAEDGAVMDDIFSPGWTNYNDYMYYSTYDVTDLVTGQNVALAARIGTGWYAGFIGRQYYAGVGLPGINELALLARLVIDYTDGSQDVIVTNAEDWLASDEGPVLLNDFFYGEIYDARLEANVANWNNVGFDDAGWGQVALLDFSTRLTGGSENTAYMLEEDRVYPGRSQETYLYDPENIDMSTGLEFGEIVPEVVDPTRNITLEKGKRLIIDMGQNLAGVTNISLSGAEGTKVQMRGAEMLNDGRANPEQRNGGSCGPKGTLYWYGLTRGRESDEYWYTDTYFMNGEKVQEYRPGFTFHGFRYLEVWADEDIVIQDVYAQPITSAVKQTGFIETNNENVNRLFINTLWSQMGNYLSIPTDCPNRSERLGWSGDVNVFTETALFNFETMGFQENYMEISENYAENNGGYFGTTMPGTSSGAGSSNAGWTDAVVILAWAMYLQTGDIAILENYYEMLSRYMDLITENGLRAGYGDWVAFQATSSTYMAVMYQAYDNQLMSKIAAALGKSDDVDKYDAEYDRLIAEIRAKYVNEEGDVLSVSADNVTGGGFMGANIILDNSQTSILWALKLGLYGSEDEKDVFVANLLENIDNEGNQVRSNAAEKTLSTGFLGVNVLLPVLTENGLSGTAYDLLLQDEMPSWLYEVKLGATTTWERWNAYSDVNSFGDYGMNSFNHYAYGAVGEWMYEYMAGIQRDEQVPGFKNTILQPVFDQGDPYNDQERIQEVNARYESYYGPIVSNWTADGGELLSYETVIPANATATLYLPIGQAFDAGSLEGMEPVAGLTYVGTTWHNGVEVAEFQLQSGGYAFRAGNGELTVSLQKGYKAM